MSQTPEHGYVDDGRRYRLDARIATGGMGEVWRGTDTTLGREVAIKVLKSEYADDPSFRTRFETEAQHAASLHHANIAAVYDFGDADAADGSGVRRPFLIMELVDGQPLSALIRPDSPMDPVAVRELLAQAADGLGAAHAAGIVHRDVKPANLLVTPDRQIKVTDFGIARAAEGMGLTQTGEVMGTPQYLSPEQAQGQTATPASDVYSLGVVAFECLAGRRPFIGETPVATALAHLREPVPDLPDSVPADLTAVVRRSMSKLPQDRFADGRALAVALRDPATAAAQVVPPTPPTEETHVLPGVVPAEPTPVPGPVPTTATPTRRRRSALWPVLGVIALVVIAVLAVLLITQSGDSANPSDERTSRTPTRSSSPPSSPDEPTSSAPTSQPPTSEATTPTTPSTPTTATTEPTSPSPSETTPPTTEPTTPPTTSPPAASSPTTSRTPTTTTTTTPAAAPSTSANNRREVPLR